VDGIVRVLAEVRAGLAGESIGVARRAVGVAMAGGLVRGGRRGRPGWPALEEAVRDRREQRAGGDQPDQCGSAEPRDGVPPVPPAMDSWTAGSSPDCPPASRRTTC